MTLVSSSSHSAGTTSPIIKIIVVVVSSWLCVSFPLKYFSLPPSLLVLLLYGRLLPANLILELSSLQLGH